MIGTGKTVIVRGGGDLATGVIYRLWRAGFAVLALETEKPLVVRRTVAAAAAIFDGECTVNGMTVRRIASASEMFGHDFVPIMADPDGLSIYQIKPDIVVDAIMAKRNTGTTKDMASLVIALGPGFTAQEDVHYVVETKRGHYLGSLISKGCAIPNTGIPGSEMGHTTERLLRAPCDGRVEPYKAIGEHVEAMEAVAAVGGCTVYAAIRGTLRGLIHPSVDVTRGLKIGDVDPRDVREHCFSITDKALAVAGGVMEAISLSI